MTKSLRARLFVGLTAVILLAGCLGGMFAYVWAYDEAIEMQDSILVQIASFAQGGGFRSGELVRGVDADSDITVLELGSAPRGPLGDRQLWGFQDGLHTSSRNGQPIRVLMRSRPDGSRFAVTQRTEIRNEIASDMAVRTLLPTAALVPCLMLVTAFVIARSLRPVVRLAGDLDARRADDLTALPLGHTPSELHPFIVSINGLLDRIKRMMERQQRFVADAAHELRTPITALSLQAENLELIDMPTEARGRLAAFRDGMRRSRYLVEQLLSLAKQDAVTPADATIVALDGIAKEAVADLMPDAARSGVDLGFERLEPVATRGEPFMILTMIRNLIDNAVRVTPQGGRVDIRVHRKDDRAVVEIEDTGPGIPSCDIDRVFEPFFRGSRPTGEGTGLGLAIVKRIVERLNGAITLVNIRDRATTGVRATVDLPAAERLEQHGCKSPQSPPYLA